VADNVHAALDAEQQRRDIVVVGASAGGVEALTRLLARLPAHFRAAMAVVLHLSPTRHSMLPAVLARATPLTVIAAAEQIPFALGSVYVGIPDRHLVLMDHRIALKRDAKEHFHRPAVDPLFRSAADIYGPRVVGVILSGAGTDGVIGAKAIKTARGMVLAQDPAEAWQPSMPRTAIAQKVVDAVLPIARLAAALEKLSRGEPIG
jgi:two-component system chemotaxis response regulator CheB